MADKKISELTSIAGTNLVDDDKFVVVDTDATETKAVSFSELKSAIVPAASVAVYVDATGGASADSTSDITVPITTTEIEDSTNYSNTSGVVTVTNAGTYVIKGNVSVVGTTPNYRWSGEVSLVKNGSTVVGKVGGGYLRGEGSGGSTISGPDAYINIDKIITLASGDTVEIKSKSTSPISGDGTFSAEMSTLQLQKL